MSEDGTRFDFTALMWNVCKTGKQMPRDCTDSDGLKVTALFYERNCSIDKIVALGKPAVKPLIAHFLFEDLDHPYRYLNYGSYMIHIYAAKALGRLGDKEAVGPLIEGLKHPYVEMQYISAIALGEIGDVAALHPLIALLKSSCEGLVINAMDALVRLGDKEAVEPLIGLFRHKECHVREHAVWALGRLGKPAVKPLIRILKNPSRGMRRAWSAETLGWIGNKEAVGPLLGALKDPDIHVMKAAAEALTRLIGQDYPIGPD